MSLLTWLLLAFMAVLYLFLFISKKELIYIARKNRKRVVLVLLLGGILSWNFVVASHSWEEALQGAAVVLIVLSFIFESRGLTEKGFVVNALDPRGTAYDLVDKVLVLPEAEGKGLRLAFLRSGLRSPLLSIPTTLEDLLAFFNEHLPVDTEVEILFDK